MPTAVPPQHDSPRDLAIASIKEALSLIGQADHEPGQFDERHKDRHETHLLSGARALELIKTFWPVSRTLQGLAGLVALACVGVVVLAWQPNQRQVAPDPVSTASVPARNKDELPARLAPNKPDLAQATNVGPAQSQAQAAPPGTPVAPIAAPIPADLARQIGEIAREVASMAQGIDQLRTEQSQMARVSAELAEQLKAARDAARRNSELTEELKATQAQMARDVSNLADELKANQDLMAGIADQIKQSQEEVARLLAAEQKQRAARKPTAKPTTPPVGAQAQDARRLQPKPQ